MDWTAFSAIVNSVLAAITVGVLFVNRQQVKASREQSEASLKQVSLMQEQLEQSQKQVQGTLEAAQRPFVFPTKLPELAYDEDTKESYFDFDEPEDIEIDRIGLKNGGTGIAANIMGFFFEPRSQDEDEAHARPPRGRMLAPLFPLPPDSETNTVYYDAAPAKISWKRRLSGDPNNTLAAPSHSKTSKTILRLTVVYSDIFGQRYGSQFDLGHNAIWNLHWFGKIAPGAELFERSNATPSLGAPIHVPDHSG